MYPPTTIDELFQRGNQYSMLEDDIVVATKLTVVATLDSWHYGGSKVKRVNTTLEIRGAPVITMRLRDWETKPFRI